MMRGSAVGHGTQPRGAVPCRARDESDQALHAGLGFCLFPLFGRSCRFGVRPDVRSIQEDQAQLQAARALLRRLKQSLPNPLLASADEQLGYVNAA